MKWDQDDERKDQCTRAEASDEPRDADAAAAGSSAPATPATDHWAQEDGEIFTRYHRDVYGFLRNKTASDSDAEAQDLMAVTFERFIRNSKKGPIVDKYGRPFRSPRGYLLGIAKFVLFEHLKKAGKLGRVEDVMSIPVAEIGRGISSQVSLAEKKSLVHQKLRELPFHLQLVLECRYFQEMSYQEIADFLDVRFGTVATWLHTGHAQLRKLIERAYAGKPIPRAFVDEEAERRSKLAAYSWYDPLTGVIDSWKLIRAVTKTHQGRGAGQLPSWFSSLGLPAVLLGACALELWQIARGTWEAWVAAGRPTV